MFFKKCITLFLITSIISSIASTQVNNGNTFYYQQQIHSLEWTKDSDSGSGDPEEPAWRLIYGANSADCDDEDTWGPDFYDDCFHFTSGGPHTISGFDASIRINPGSPVPFNSEIKVDIRGHENDDISGSVEAACEADGNDDDEECGERTFTVADGSRGAWRFLANTENNFKWTWKALWRYANGDNQSTPLDFGTLDSETVFHNNNTDGPSGSVVGIASYNNINFAQTGRDVFYKFTIEEPMKVTISTLNNTDFDTYLYLYRSIRYPTVFLENDNAGGSTRSEIEAVICPGTYLIVVDGKNSASGEFQLTLTVSDDISEAISTGSISTYTTPVIDGDPIPIIQSTGASTNSVHNTTGITYQWEKSDNLGITWQTVANSNVESLPYGSITMGTNDVYIRRKTTSLCIDVSNSFIETTNTAIVPSATFLSCNSTTTASTSSSSTLQNAPMCTNRGAASNPNGSKGKWFYGFASNDGLETIRVNSMTSGKHPNVFVYERSFDPEIFDDGSEFPGYFCNSSNSGGQLSDNNELQNEVTVTIDSEIDINGDLFIFVSAVEGGDFDFEITRDCNPNCENLVRYQNDHYLPSLTQGQEIKLYGNNIIKGQDVVSFQHLMATSIYPDFEVEAGGDFTIGLTGCN